jgi:hypothetical protein
MLSGYTETCLYVLLIAAYSTRGKLLAHLHSFYKTCLNLVWMNVYPGWLCVVILVFIREVRTAANMLCALVVRK